MQKYERSSVVCYGTRFQDSRSCAYSVAFPFASDVGIPDSGNFIWLNVCIGLHEIRFCASQSAARTHAGGRLHDDIINALFILTNGAIDNLLLGKFKFHF